MRSLQVLSQLMEMEVEVEPMNVEEDKDNSKSIHLILNIMLKHVLER